MTLATRQLVSSQAQESAGVSGLGIKNASVFRASSEIKLDGVLDGPWENVPTIGELVQREPKEGQPPTERTEVKLLYDSDNFYIGVMCYDSEPGRIIAAQMSRDADLGSDDKIEILIDTFHDRRNAFYFATNPAGILVDGLIIENGELNKEWDAIWDVRVQRSEQGWSAEIAIPFKSLTFRSGQQTWGFNLSRYIKRKLEEDRWTSPRLDIRFFQVSEAGELSGLEDVERGSGIDVRPFVSGHSVHDAEADKDVLNGKGGLDAFYKVTPNLKLTATVNTDFAETEVDDRQINLTRFALFFPEKRSFFLENTGIFSFGRGFVDSGPGGGSSDLIPFFSRRIGILADKEIPIDAGAKLAGTAGRYDLGLLDVRTRQTPLTPAKNFVVARVKRKILRQSYFGGIFSQGDPSGSLRAQTYGSDLRLATSNFANTHRNLFFEAFAIKSDNRGGPKDDASFGAGVALPSDFLDFSMDWKQIDANFKPALGFVPRSNVRKLNVSTTLSPRPKHFMNVRQMFHEFRFSRFTRLDKGKAESWRVFTAPVNYTLNSGDQYEFNYAPTFERLFEPFEIASGIVLPPGDYRFTRWRAQFQTASKRPWKVDGAWWFGTYWSGRANEVNTSLQIRMAPHFQSALSLNQTFARLKQGSFVTRILTLHSNYSFSPFLTFFNLLQFDNQSRNMGWQSRIRWIAKPGNEVFVVFNQGWIQEEGGGARFHAGNRNIASKIQYTFRF